MRQKQTIFLIIFSVLLFSLFLPPQIQAAGLVPCGGCDKYGPDPDNPEREICTKPGPTCQFCHFFVLFKNIVDFFLFKIVPSLAALMIVIAGFYFFLAGPNPQMLSTARAILTSTLWGLIIIYGAWVFINLFFDLIGVNTWTGLTKGWWKINCPIK